MPKDFQLKLRCKRNEDDGTYNGGIYIDGQQDADPDLMMYRVDCEGMQELWRRASNKYNKNPQVVGDCVVCFPESFFENETLYPD